MKPLRFLMCAALGGAALAAMSAPAAPPVYLPLIPDTVALYHFNEGSGTTLADASGNGYAASLKNGATWVPGQDGSAVDFGGDRSSVEISPTIDMVTLGPAWTLQAWVRFPLASNGYLVASQNSGGYWAPVKVESDILGTYLGSNGWRSSGVDVTTISPGWHLLSASAYGNQTHFYIDAGFKGTANGQVPTTVPQNGSAIQIKGIGGHDNQVASCGGAIDSLRIMKVARSAAEIASDFNTLHLPSNLAGSPGQFSLSHLPVAPGGKTKSGFIVKSAMSGASPLHLDVEIKPVGIPFNETGVLISSDVCSGDVATVPSGNLAIGTYRWRVRAVNAFGPSPWFSFGGEVDVEIVAGPLPPGPPPPTSLPLIPGSVALYQFNEGGGTTTADETGAYPAFLSSPLPPLWVPGNGGGSALSFSPNGSLYFTNNGGLPVGTFWTLQAVVLLPVADNGSGFSVLASNGSTSGSHVVLKNGELGMTTAGEAQFQGTGTHVSTLTGWHLISAVGALGRTAFYVDSAPVGTVAAQVTRDISRIGDGNAGRPWGGPIDGLRILNVARSAGEIAGDANTLFPPPDLAGAPGQFMLSDASIDPGGKTKTGFVMKAMLAGASPLRLEVEVKPTADPFNETGVLTRSDVDHASVASVSTGTLALGSHHWRLRAVNGYGTTPWMEFGSDPEVPGEVDVEIVAGSVPTAGPAVQRLGLDGSVLASGQVIYDGDGVRFEVVGSDLDDDAVHLDVEVRLAGSAFLNAATATSPPVSSGQTASCGVSLPPGGYVWQSRIVDADGLGTVWTPFGAMTGNADFVIRWGGSSGTVCAVSAAGGPAMALLAALLVASAIRRR